MKKKILLSILLILVIVLGSTLFYIFMEKNEEDNTVFVVPNLLKPYIRIQKNIEKSSTELTLNGNNKEMYYYFDIYNYDEIANEYNQIELLPYVKLDVQNDNNIQNLVTMNLYYIKDLEKGFSSGNYEEITKKGDIGTKFENYYECKKLDVYDSENLSENVSHYVAKITLNNENQEYIDLSQNLSQKFEIILGYKQY